jgi:pimeloyl-ACP methyl ester carboxylesterase
MNPSLQNGTVVLVHGAWADGSCWRNIILPLRRHGLTVTCAPIPLTSLTEDVTALHRVLKRTSGPVILVGHAYGGAVIAGATGEQVRALVYIAALAPDENESVADVFYRADPHPEAPHLAPDADGFIWMPEEGFARAVSHKALPDEALIMAAVQRPIALKCIQETSPAPAWKTKPSWFLIAEEDRMISPQTQRFMADRMGAKIRSSKVDHSPMLTKPDLVVDVILEAVRETVSPVGSSAVQAQGAGG